MIIEYRVENKYDPYLIRNEFNTYIEDVSIIKSKKYLT